jgi:transcription antitermination factor NusA-like protein
MQALYGIQEKGWRGYAYRGMIINVEMAKKIARAGKLHLDVPEEAMGRIIGSKGSNINFVTANLRKKGVDVSKIIHSNEQINGEVILAYIQHDSCEIHNHTSLIKVQVL